MGLQILWFFVLKECEEQELDEQECKYIKQYDSTNPDNGYNIDSGGAYGFKNANLNIERADEIKNLLMNSTDLSEVEIANMFGISKMSVYYINVGRSYNDPTLSYPLRKERVVSSSERQHNFIQNDGIERVPNRCIDCGCEIEDTSIRCVKCNNRIRRKISASKEEVEGKLLSYGSFYKVYTELGVSHITLRRFCQENGLPSNQSELKMYLATH